MIGRLQKVGEYWVPDIDMRRFSRWGKVRRKTIRRFRDEGGGDFSVLRAALEHVPGNTFAVDGGANIGAYTRVLAEHFQRIVAFEPAEDTYEALASNIRDWGLAERVETHPWALSDRAANVGLGKRNSQRSVSRRISGEGSIPAITLDSLELAAVDFIKLDVEGFEYQALKGAEQTLLRCRPAVLFEDKPDKLRGRDTRCDPHQLLEQLGAQRVACLGHKQFDYLYQFPAE